MATIAQYRGTGKRKTSVARVILRPGDGSTWINGRSLEEYFPREALRTTATAPLRTADAAPAGGRGGSLRPAGAHSRRWAERPGRRAPARHRPRPRRGGPGAPRRAEA